MISRLGKLFCASVFSICCGGQLQAELAPAKLNERSYDAVKRYLEEPKQTFLEVDWQPTVLDGLNLAVKEDKPILLWLYFGGPLGNC